MARKIYGTRHNGFGDATDMFEMKVVIGDVLGSGWKNRYPYQKISLINLVDGSLEEEFSLPVLEEFDVNEDTVFDYLDFFIYSFGHGDDINGNRSQLTTTWTTNGRNPIAIRRMSTGVLTRFNFSREGSSDNLLKIAVQPSDKTRVRQMWGSRTFTLLKTDFGKELSFVSVNTNRDGLAVSVHFEDNSVLYTLVYKERMDLESAAKISLGLCGRRLSPEYFATNFVANEDENPLMWKSVGDFHYLESADCKLRLVVDNRSKNVTTVLSAIQKAVEQSSYSENTKFHIQRDLGDNVIEALKGGKNEDAKIMNACIDMYDSLKAFDNI